MQNTHPCFWVKSSTPGAHGLQIFSDGAAVFSKMEKTHSLPLSAFLNSVPNPEILLGISLVPNLTSVTCSPCLGSNSVKKKSTLKTYRKRETDPVWNFKTHFTLEKKNTKNSNREILLPLETLHVPSMTCLTKHRPTARVKVLPFKFGQRLHYPREDARLLTTCVNTCWPRPLSAWLLALFTVRHGGSHTMGCMQREKMKRQQENCKYELKVI